MIQEVLSELDNVADALYDDVRDDDTRFENIEKAYLRIEELCHSIISKLDEVQAICIGADSPDAVARSEQEPLKELAYCKQDLSAISNIIETIGV